jgi:hypothetical protein
LKFGGDRYASPCGRYFRAKTTPERVEDRSHQLTLPPHWQQTTGNWQLFVSPFV